MRMPPADNKSTDGESAAALEQLRRSLRRFFQRRVGSQDVEDLVQQVFLNMVRQGEREDITKRKSYIFQVAANVLRDRYRRAKASDALAHEPLDEEDLDRELPSAERIYEAQQALERVLEAIEELPPKCRAIFLLQRFEGLSYTEIANRYGVTRSAIEKHMIHALALLASRLPD